MGDSSKWKKRKKREIQIAKLLDQVSMYIAALSLDPGNESSEIIELAVLSPWYPIELFI